MKPKLILALDVDSHKKAKYFIDKLYPTVKIFKVGAQLFTACGPEVIQLIRKKGAEAFLDLKYFDIPNTVAGAVRQAVRMRVKMLTMHILGDEEMLKAALSAAKDEARKLRVKRPLLIGVTVLTSKEANFSDVLTLARIGLESGLDGVVCSVREAKLLRSKFKKKFVIVTPGIRHDKDAKFDQKRIATITDAIKAGSDYMVVGRPILQAPDPLKSAKDFV
jgi:orotidine-5'-phosphate decarboxylase